MEKESVKNEFDFKKFLNKLWFVLWKDDSPKGWIISIIFLFVIIKFVFFPLMSLATGTSLPLAIVESCSMYHKGFVFHDFDSWWQRHEGKYSDLKINKEDFENASFTNGFNKGDILFIIGAKPEKLKIGDVIIFEGGTANPIIHRIINISKQNGDYIFSTIGDNNNGQLFSEKKISSNQLVGKAVFKLVPFAGWVKLIFFEFKRQESERGFCKENSMVTPSTAVVLGV